MMMMTVSCPGLHRGKEACEHRSELCLSAVLLSSCIAVFRNIQQQSTHYLGSKKVVVR